MKTVKISLLGAMLAGVLTSTPAQAQVSVTPGPNGPITDAVLVNPGTILRRGVRVIRTLRERCVNRNEQVTAECLAAIHFLKSQGCHDLAVRVARICCQYIQRFSTYCINRIQQICIRCRAALSMAGAPHHMFATLQDECDAAIMLIRESARDSCVALREAVSG